MSKNKSKVIFHGKEMNLLEAKLYLFGLDLKIVGVNLSGEENKEYSKLLNIERNRNELARKLVGKRVRKEPTKRDYIISLLEEKINAAKVLEKMEYCKRKGRHKEEKGSDYTPLSFERTITYVRCKRCGISYEKKPNLQENKSLIERIYNPFRVIK
jgi:hypothetical protein